MNDLDDLVLLKIFSFISIRKLNKLKPTCKKWNHLIVEAISSRKTRVETLLYVNKHESSECTLNDLINSESFNRQLDDDIDKLSIANPEFCLLFANTQFSSHLIETDLILNHLKEKIHIRNGLISCAYGCIGTDLQNTKTVEIEADKYDALSAILFPESKYYKIILAKNLKEISELTNDFILNYIFLISKSWRPFKTNEIKRFKCPVSGGLVDSLHLISASNTNEESNANCFAIVSQNKDDVRIAQVVVPSCELDEFNEIANDKLTKLQQTGIYNDKSDRSIFALQVTCCGKGMDFHSSENYETIMFRKYFPNIKIIGFYANGEIGFDFLPDYTQSEPDLIADVDKIKTLGLTTIFTIVSVRN